ncbi:MAG: M3 family metallopeptidase [Fidelibacterota bacterium]
MKNLFLLFLAILFTGISCTRESAENPFFTQWKTPLGTPPFEKIRTGHFMPAFEEGMRLQKAEVHAIIANPEPATFENTIAALDYSGELLRRVSAVFYALNGAHTNDELQQIAREIAPQLSKHEDDIGLNDTLFQRIKSVYDQRERLDLNAEQAKLLEKYYQDFVRGGANLADESKKRYREINEELAVLTTKFGENVLKEDNNFELVIDNAADLAGLPDNVIAAGAAAAKERGYAGKWVYTLHKPSWIPFLTYSEKRDLRKKIYLAYTNRCNNDNEYDNKAIAARIAALRAERAQLLGFPTHAHYVLDVNMAKNPANVYKLLDQLWRPALQRARAELRDMQAIARREGARFQLECWDWWYYAEKLKKEKYALDDDLLRPYFQLKNVRQGAFDLATKLWGITFHERRDIPVYHEDVQVFEVKDADGTILGMLYVDYHPRASKRGGAWCGSFRKQMKKDGRNITPLMTNVFNLSKPTAEKPALLSLDEVETIFHEFGHALHGLFSDGTYPRLTGTSVPRDFVELPSQIMENWALEPEVLKSYAFHYETGEPIPDELIEKIRKASLFNQGFATVEYLAAAYLDMDWHTLTTPRPIEDVLEFEDESLGRIGLIPEIISRYRTPYFRHIFTSGYSAGYYSYIWAEVLDADAFQAFKETDLFNRELAQSFRENILARGGSEEPMVLYKRFRGREPSIEPLLEKRGLK